MDRIAGVEAIERELAALWSGFAADPEAAPMIRACSMNLIILSGAGDDRIGIDTILDRLTSDHPARTFLVTGDRKAATLETLVSAKCSVPLPGQKQVCSEQINVIASPDSFARVPSLVSSLLVPDVPVVLLMITAEEFPEVLVDQLERVSDLVILDSATDPELRQAYRLLESSRRAKFSDLAWERTSFWRRLTALLFEQPAALNKLAQLERTMVTYSGADSRTGHSSAALFKGWIRHALRSSADPRIPPAPIDLVGKEEVATDSGIVMVEFVFRDKSSFRLLRGKESTCPVATHLRGKEVVSEQVIPIRDIDDVQRIAVMLSSQEGDHQYHEALRALAAA